MAEERVDPGSGHGNPGCVKNRGCPEPIPRSVLPDHSLSNPPNIAECPNTSGIVADSAPCTPPFHPVEPVYQQAELQDMEG